MSSKPSTPDFILSAIVAGAVFVLLLILLEIPLIMSLVAALASFGVGAIFLRTKSESQVERESSEKTLLENGRAQRKVIASLASRVNRAEVSARIRAILVGIDKILETLEADPTKIPAALQFLDYYLNTTVRVLTVYLSLSEKGVHDAEIQTSLVKAEDTLGTLAEGFESKLAKLLSKDVADLNTEIKVLQQNLIGDGLIDAMKSKADSLSSIKK